MMNAELYKIRTHKTPLLTAAAALAGVLAPSVAFIWYSPGDPSAYTDTYMGVFSLVAALAGAVFGAWLLGTEYRQGTVKRLLTHEPRRMRALATKGAVGAGVLATATAAIGTIGWAAARWIGSLNDVTVAFEWRELVGVGLFAMVAAAIAYGLSAITRSDSFAMVGTIGTLLVLDPLLSLIPKVGDYTLGNVTGVIQNAIQNTAEPFAQAATISTMTAVITLGAWLAAVVGGGALLFQRRDA